MTENAGLGVGHIWWDVSCPAYRTLNGADCTCTLLGKLRYHVSGAIARGEATPIVAREIVGTCPACSGDVFSDEPDGPVWTCPADLSETNRYVEPCLYPELVERWESEGYYGRCGEDVGLSCYDPMPLHSACYDKGNY